MSPAPYRKAVFCADLAIHDDVHEVFCVTRVERRAGKNGPFLTLEFTDRSGRLPGVAWDDVERLLEVLVEGELARVAGTITEFRGEPQIQVRGAEPAPELVEAAEYLATGPVPAAVSLAAIRGLVDSMADPWLVRLVRSFLDDPDFARSFAEAPAAKVNHHAYVGGLVEHTRSVMELCAAAAEHYAGVDRDLLLAGAFCHDVGKTIELAVRPGFPYTERGALLGHIPLGFAMLRERVARIEGFPEHRATDLGHLVLSHQGELEWGSPVQPQTLEAIVLHFLDNLDSKVGTARPHLDGIESGGRTGYVRSLGRSLFRRDAGSRPESVRPDEERPVPPARPGGGPDAAAGPTLFDDVEPEPS